VSGVTLHWAYSPSEVQVLVSADGANFVEAACWRSTTQKEASYIEHIMFDRPLTAQTVSIVMRGPRAWGYFGLNAVAAMSEGGAFMLVSGTTSAAGEQCLVRTEGTVGLAPCLRTLADGSGSEVFNFNSAGQLQSSAGECVSGGAAGKLTLASCASRAGAESALSVTQNGQLKFRQGNGCIVAKGASLAVQPCDEAGRSSDAADKFIMVGVPTFDRGAASAAKMSADLALRTAHRLAGTVSALENALASCGMQSSLAKRVTATSTGILGSEMVKALNLAELQTVLDSARAAIASARLKV